MIIGVGTDIVEIKRIRRSIELLPRFVCRILTAFELSAAAEKGENFHIFLAGRWAAKEAISKALGCGIGAKCSWQDIEILNDASGRPQVRFSGAAAATFGELGGKNIHLSISHEHSYACAVAILEQ